MLAAAQIRRYNHDRLPTYGRLKGTPKRRVQDLLQALIRHGYVAQEGLRFPTLGLTAEGSDVMHERVHPVLGAWQKTDNPTKEKITRTPGVPIDSSLRDTLRAWRHAKARALKVPPYMLFWDRTLDELAHKKPSTSEELLAVWGLGEQKRRLFGDELLSVIAGKSSAKKQT